MTEPQDTQLQNKDRPEAATVDDEELRELLTARKKINLRIRAKKAGKKTEARRLRERRAMLTGLAVMDALERDATVAERALIHRWRDKWLTRSKERAVFNLAPLSQPPSLVVDNPPPASVEREMESA
jgi:hypothetical protein